jgi:hypothetical protein
VLEYGRLPLHLMQNDLKGSRLLFAEHSLRPRRRLSAATIVITALLITLNALSGYSQSGRRLPKASAPTPEAKPQEQPKEKSKSDEKPRVAIILGIAGRHISYNVPSYFYDSVLQSCADRLRDAPSVKLNVSGRDINRAEAIKLAKSQKEAYVALLDLRNDGMSARTMSSDSYDEILIDFVVFAPETAKVTTSGRTYQRAYRKGPIVVGPRTGRTSPIYAEQMLKQAARDAADRILSALHLVIPGRTIPPIANDRPPLLPHKSG